MLTISFAGERDSDVWVTSNTLKLTGGRLFMSAGEHAIHGAGQWHYGGESFTMARVSGPLRLVGERGSLMRDFGTYGDLRITDWSVVDGKPVMRFDADSYLWRFLDDNSMWDTVNFMEG